MFLGHSSAKTTNLNSNIEIHKLYMTKLNGLSMNYLNSNIEIHK